MQKLILKNGKEINLSLTYGDLYRLQQNRPELVEEYFAIQGKENVNELDMVKVLFIAYRTQEEEMKLEEFLDMIPQNRATIQKVYIGLLFPKN